MKKQAAETGGHKAPPQDDGSSQRLLEGYNRFFQTWSSFRQDLESQIDENVKKQQRMYDDFFGQWNKLSGEVSKRLNKDSANGPQREFYDVWRNYTNKIGPRVVKAMTEGMQNYGGITSSIDRYSKVIGSEAQKLTEKAEWDPRRLEQLYDAWLEFGTTVRKQMDSAMSKGRGETDQISKTWFEFSNRMQQLMSNLGERSGDWSELSNLWMQFSREVGDSLIQVVNGTSQDQDKLQKTWTQYYSKIEKEMARLADEIGMGYEELYERFFEQQNMALERMSQWWQVANETARSELTILEKRLLDLEKRIKDAPH
jgi:hypothetical protein